MRHSQPRTNTIPNVQSLYAFTTRFFILGYYCTHESLGGCRVAAQSFSYFTILTYWGLAFYFLVSATHTFTYALTGRPLLARLPRSLQALHSLYYSTVVAFPPLVTIVYWVVLYKNKGFAEEFSAWENVSQHGLNSLFALFEIFVPRTEIMPWVHIPWLVLILVAYLSVAFITLADQGWYTYNFLDWEKIGGRQFVAAYVLGIAVGIIVLFCLVKGLVWLRVWVTETKLGMKGKFAQHGTVRGDLEMHHGKQSIDSAGHERLI